MRLALTLSIAMLLSLAACQTDRRPPLKLGVAVLCQADEQRPIAQCRGVAIEIPEEEAR